MTTLSGCALQQSDAEVAHGGGEAAPAETVAQEEQPAFHFKSGDLVLGEFDPYTIGDDLFNPCEEISDEEFAELGLHAKRDLGYNPVTQKAGCYFKPDDPRVQIGFVSNAANKLIVLSKMKLHSENDWGSVPGAYVFEHPNLQGNCYAMVDTERGAFGTNAVSVSIDDQNYLCALAQDGLERIYSAAK
ncbi:DUF3558 family protein [Corynebacterium sp. UBA2622]|uniref:DUF3558 family protein n=1 Tax=Corynebacterium sp. UBA2622 TaxID=1946393 RepID=UPI0025BC7977|nr:DUF3558 family protein [Corynebacterium sp. UBA2622]